MMVVVQREREKKGEREREMDGESAGFHYFVTRLGWEN